MVEPYKGLKIPQIRGLMKNKEPIGTFFTKKTPEKIAKLQMDCIQYAPSDRLSLVQISDKLQTLYSELEKDSCKNILFYNPSFFKHL